jgi:hypothetical protein
MDFQLSWFVTEDGDTNPFRNVGNYLSGKNEVEIAEYPNIRLFLLIVRLLSLEALDTSLFK